MMKLKKALENEKFVLEVTMPQTIVYADAALKGGAMCLKLRCNQNSVGGFSNGVFNGPFQTRKAFLKETVEHAGDIPVGLVPGIPGNVITPEECREAVDLGIDFINCDPMYLAPYVMDTPNIGKVLCYTYENRSPDLMRWFNEDPKVDAVELGLLPHSEFGKRLTYHDLYYYRDAAKNFRKPLIATAERHILPEEVRYLYDAGIRSLMIGLSVYYGFLEQEGGELTPEFVTRITERYREAIEKL